MVAGVVAGVAGVEGVEGWGRRRVAAAPDFDLFGAVLLGRFLFIQALEGAVVALVQAPVALDREVTASGDSERDVRRSSPRG